MTLYYGSIPINMIEWAKSGREILNKRKDLSHIERALLQVQVKDAELSVRFLEKSQTISVEKDAYVIEAQDLLIQAIKELKKGDTPESVTNYWRAKWQDDGAKIGLKVTVPDCNWTEEEIKRPMTDIKGNPIPGMMIYKPEQIRGEEGLNILLKMYPQMPSFSVGRYNSVEDTYEYTPIEDTHDTGGWIKVEATINAPNLNTRQKELVDFARKQGYLGQTEGTYILASQASRDLTRIYLDQSYTWSRLLGSRNGDYVSLRGYINTPAYTDVFWFMRSQNRHPALGARFEEVKRT